uniref:Proteoglycan 4-like n=1 Tax=Globodera pallida TaxID=36090 RepID=A0A183C7G1_GLOPA
MNKWTAATQIVFCLLLLVVVAGTSRFPSASVRDLLLLLASVRESAHLLLVSVLALLGLNRFRHALMLPPFLVFPPTPARPHAPAIPRLPAHARPVERIPSVPVAVHIHLAPVLLVPQVNPAPEKSSTEAAKPTSEKSSTEAAKPTSEKSSTEAAKPTSEKSGTEAAKPTSEKSGTEAAKTPSEKSGTEAAKTPSEQPKAAVTDATKGAEDGRPTDRT